MTPDRAIAALLACGLAACGSDSGPADAAAPSSDAAIARDAEVQADAGTAADAALEPDAGPEPDAGVAPGPDFRTTLASSDEFASLASRGAVKFLLNADGATPRAPLLERCYFQNTLRFEYHIHFLHSFPELATLTARDYEAMVLRRATRVWWGGALLETNTRHPISGAPTSLAYQVYAEAGGATGLREADIVEVDRILKACVPFAVQRLAFVPGDPFQQTLARGARASLEAQGVAVLLQ